MSCSPPVPCSAQKFNSGPVSWSDVETMPSAAGLLPISRSHAKIEAPCSGNTVVVPAAPYTSQRPLGVRVRLPIRSQPFNAFGPPLLSFLST
eukprot:scaffold224120_cov26-Tisochrysis_lutea.AAC.1